MRDLDVREVMTPRMDVTALTIPVRVEDVAQAVQESGHSTFPVVEGDLDDLIGVLFVTDLFLSRRASRNEPLPDVAPIDISRRIRPAHVVPETRGVLETLAEMRAARRTFAVVVDEHGSVAGVLTIKDLLEPLVGTLHDELDAPEEPGIVRVDNDHWLVDGRVSVDEVSERLNLDVPEGQYVTLGGYLCDALDRIPEEGESLVTPSGWELGVMERDKLRVAKVMVTRAGAEAEAPGGEAAASPGLAARPPTAVERHDGSEPGLPTTGNALAASPSEGHPPMPGHEQR